MQNPFEVIINRLDSIEALINRVLTHNTIQQAAPEVGGIELAQEVTRLSKARIYTLVSERTIPHAKRGNRLTFSRADLLAWLDAGKRATA